MGNWKAAPRKRRKHHAILRDAPLFSNAIYEKDFDKAARIVVGTALEVLGVNGLMNAFYRANYFLRRQKFRRGL